MLQRLLGSEDFPRTLLSQRDLPFPSLQWVCVRLACHCSSVLVSRNVLTRTRRPRPESLRSAAVRPVARNQLTNVNVWLQSAESPTASGTSTSTMPSCCTVQVGLQKYHICKSIKIKTINMNMFTVYVLGFCAWFRGILVTLQPRGPPGGDNPPRGFEPLVGSTRTLCPLVQSVGLVRPFSDRF